VKLYPDDKPVPELLEKKEYSILPLKPLDNQLDYDAVTASLDYYRKFHPCDWSATGFTLEENLEELEKHDQDHQERTAFTLSAQSPNRELSFGCIYINTMHGLLKWLKRPEDELKEVKDYECQVYFWTRPECMASGLDKEILFGLSQWLENDWLFSKVYYQTYESDVRQVSIFKESGLKKWKTSSLPGGEGNVLIFTR
jgi:hypothetical protein